MKFSNSNDFIETVRQQNPGQAEFIQAVSEFIDSICSFPPLGQFSHSQIFGF